MTNVFKVLSRMISDCNIDVWTKVQVDSSVVMRKIFCIVGILLLPLLISSVASAEKRQVEGYGTYLMGDSEVENVAVAKERAKQEALRNASEQAAVFVESMSVVDKGVLTSDEIRTYTASILNIIGTPQISMKPDGNGILFHCHLVATVDSDDFKNITPESMRESKRLAEENARLAREMDELKQKYDNAASEAARQEIRSQLEQTSGHYMTVQDAEAAERYFNEGWNYDRNKSYGEAVAAYQKAIHFNPQHYVAYNNLGGIYKEVLNDDAKAEEYFWLAIKINPLYSLAYHNLGFIYSDKHDYVKAEECYKKAIQIDPQDADAYYKLGFIYSDKHDYVKAEECYKKAVQINPRHAYGYYGLAMVYCHLNRDNDALKYAEKSISIKPDEYTWGILGLVYFELGQYAKAIDACNKSLDFNNNIGYWYYIRGQAYEKQGDMAKAKTDIRRAMELSPDDTEIRQAYQRLQGANR